MPDKDDPKHKARYERGVEAGRKFGDAVGLDKLGYWLQRVGSAHKKAFLVLVFGFVISCFAYNVYCFVRVSMSRDGRQVSAVARQDSVLNQIIENRKNREP